MPEHFIVVDDPIQARRTADLLVPVWRHVEVAASPEEALAQIQRLGDRVSGLVVVVDSRVLDDEGDFRIALSSRPRTEVVRVVDDVRDAQGRFSVVRPYGDSLTNEIEKVVADLRLHRLLPYLVSITIKSDDGKLSNGTGCLVQLPRRKVILTAHHVVAAMRRPNATTNISGTGQPRDITSWQVVGEDADVDIATIGVPDEFDPATIKSRFYVPPHWPPARAKRGQAVVMVGFPSEHLMKRPGGMKLAHGALYADFVSSSSDRHFVVAPELDREVSSMTPLLDSVDDTGGMSGCPIFVIDDESKAAVRGVLKEGTGGNNAVLIGVHTDFIRDDGTIDPDVFR
jgi:hypothetical protein